MWSRAAFLAASILATGAYADSPVSELRLVQSIPLYYPHIGLTEPSGLAVDPGGEGFWIVSDEAETVFWLGSDGELTRFIGLDRRMRDLEGITVDAANDRLLMVSEHDASIIEVSLRPPHRVTEFPLAKMKADKNLQNILSDRRNGLEGITINSESGSAFVVKERNPRLLIEVAPTLDHIISVKSLDDILAGIGKAKDDVSGIVGTIGGGGFWILSDTGNAVYLVAADSNQPEEFALLIDEGDRLVRLKNAEGIALSPNGEFLYVVSDDGKDSKLVEYQIVRTR